MQVWKEWMLQKDIQKNQTDEWRGLSRLTLMKSCDPVTQVYLLNGSWQQRPWWAHLCASSLSPRPETELNVCWSEKWMIRKCWKEGGRERWRKTSIVCHLYVPSPEIEPATEGCAWTRSRTHAILEYRMMLQPASHLARRCWVFKSGGWFSFRWVKKTNRWKKRWRWNICRRWENSLWNSWRILYLDCVSKYP